MPIIRLRKVLKKSPVKNLQKLKMNQLEKICKKHGTTTRKIPAWLLKKNPTRLEYWFEHGD